MPLTSVQYAENPGPVAALSEELQLPMEAVSQTYWAEVQRLGAQARIRNYIPLLAIRNTRALLRGQAGCERRSVARPERVVPAGSHALSSGSSISLNTSCAPIVVSE